MVALLKGCMKWDTTVTKAAATGRNWLAKLERACSDERWRYAVSTTMYSRATGTTQPPDCGWLICKFEYDATECPNNDTVR